MVSIIILVRDNLEFISRCVESIIQNTITNFEFVFILQAVKSKEVIEYINSIEHDKLIIVNVENTGVTPGRNLGIQCSTGDYLLFFDDDAFVNNDLTAIPEHEHSLDWLERMLQYYKNPKVGIVSPSGSFINIKTPGVFWKCDSRGGFCDVGQGYCFMFSRSVVNTIGLLDTYFGRFWHEESEYALRAKANGFKVVNSGYIGVFHLGSGSGDDGTYRDKINYMFKKWQGKFPEILERNSF